MKKIVIGSTIAMLSFSLACASAPAPSPSAASSSEEATESPRRGAFLWLRSIDGFNTVDDQHIVLHAGRRHALVKVFGFCHGLRFSETIGIDAPLSHLDESGLGHIVYRREPHDIARCPIDRLVEVASVKEARELVAKEKAEKEAAADSAEPDDPPK